MFVLVMFYKVKTFDASVLAAASATGVETASERKRPPAFPPRVDGWAGTGEAIAPTRVDRNVSETFASPVTEVGLDGDAKGTVAPALPVARPQKERNSASLVAGCSTPRPAGGRLPRPSISPTARSLRSARPAGDEGRIARGGGAGISLLRSNIVRRRETPHPPFGHLLPQGEKAMKPRSWSGDRAGSCRNAFSLVEEGVRQAGCEVGWYRAETQEKRPVFRPAFDTRYAASA